MVRNTQINQKTNNMKRSFLLIITLIPLMLKSQNVLFEDFNYPANDSLENSGQWHRTGIDTKFNIKIATPGLEYPSYSGSGVGNCAQISNDGNGDVLLHNFKSVIDSGSVYLSLLIRVDSLSDKFTEGSTITLNPPTGTYFNTILTVKRITNKTFSLGVRKVNAPVYTNEIYEVNKTYLAVLKYTFLSGDDNDISSLNVFKSEVPNTEPTTVMAESSSGLDFVGQNSIHVSNNYAENGLRGCDIKIDGIRVGTSWETSVLAQPTGVYNINIPTIECNIFPNPVSEHLNIDLNLEQSSYVNISILNSIGSVCETILNTNKNSGNHSFKWQASAFPSGTYFMNIQINDRKFVQPFQVIKN